MIDTNYCFFKNSQIIYKQAGDALCLIDPYRQKLVKLNETASRVWQLLDGKHSVSQITEILAERFDIKKEVLKKDILNLIQELLKREIIN